MAFKFNHIGDDLTAGLLEKLGILGIESLAFWWSALDAISLTNVFHFLFCLGELWTAWILIACLYDEEKTKSLFLCFR